MKEPIGKAGKIIDCRTPEMEVGTEKEKKLANKIVPSLLTRLEYGVIQRFVDGASRNEIARELEITPADVVEIKNSALDKLKREFPRALQDYERKRFAELMKRPRRIIA